MTNYDAIIIGAGQGGGPLAGAFAKAGQRALLVEREHVGGTCINEGCTPTKTMIASGRIAYLARRGSEYGVRVGDVTVDMQRVRERKRNIVDSFRSGSERALAAAGADLLRGHGRFIAPRTIEVIAADGTRTTVKAPVVVINTGMRSAMPDIPGIGSVATLDSTSIMELDTAPEHLIVLGGGYVGLEFSQLFHRLGSRVTVLHRGSQLLPREDADIAKAIADLFRQDGIEVRLGAAPSKVGARAGGGIALTLQSGEEIVGSHLLAATGRRPNTSDLGADAGGVRLDEKGFVVANARLETTAEGVYAIGDVNGGPAFTHISYDDYRILRANLLHGGNLSTTGRLLPYTVFIDPQLGRVGMTETEARARGFDIRVATMPMSRVARALEMDEARGVMKAVVDHTTQKILGAAVLGIEGGEVATLIQVAMMGDLPYSALRDGVFSHPTLAESLNNLFAQLGD